LTTGRPATAHCDGGKKVFHGGHNRRIVWFAAIAYRPSKVKGL